MSYLEVLASFVPSFLVERLARTNVVSLAGPPDVKPPSVTNAEKFQAAVLEVCIMKDGEQVSGEIDIDFEELNTRFETIIEHIMMHGGDIVKQTTGSILSLWNINSNSEELNTVVYRATKCAQVLAGMRDLASPFYIFCRVAAGNVYAFWVGRTTFHFVLSGAPFLQIEDHTKLGKKKHPRPGVVLSPDAWDVVRKYCKGEPDSGSNFMVLKAIKREISRPVLCPQMRKIPVEDYTLSFIKQMEQSLRTFIPNFSLAKIDSFFMNENPMMSVGKAGQKHKASRTLNTSLRLPANLAEIRQVTIVSVLFPGLLPSSYSQCLESVDEDLPFLSDSASSPQPQDAIRTLQGIVVFVQTLLHHYEGCLTSLIVDSEGTKMTITFGLFPFLHEDDPLRAVLLGLELKALNERNQVGISTARVLSALVGSKQRRAFAIAGGCAQRAAYLMTCSAGLDDAVVCDKETYRISRCLNRCRDEDLRFEKFNKGGSLLDSLILTSSNSSVRTSVGYSSSGCNSLSSSANSVATSTFLADNSSSNEEEPDDEFKAYNSGNDEKGEIFLVHLKKQLHEESVEKQVYVNTRPPPFRNLKQELEVVKEVTVGRSKEKQLLRERLDLLLEEGEGAAVLIEGEAGIGKTNLIHDFLMKASTHSITTLYGAADPLNKSSPYDVWKGVFQAMLEQENIVAEDQGMGDAGSEFDDDGVGDCSEESEYSYSSSFSGRSERSSGRFSARSSGIYEYPEEECVEPRRVSTLKFNFDYSRRMIHEDEQDFISKLVEEKRKALCGENVEATTATPMMVPPAAVHLLPPPLPHGGNHLNNPYRNPLDMGNDESGEISTRKKQESSKNTKQHVADYIYSQLELEGNEHFAALLNEVLDLSFPENDVTLQMSVEMRLEKINDLLLYLLQDPTETPKIIILENAQNFHPASWTLLHKVVKNVASVLFIITTRELMFDFQKEEMKKFLRAVGVEKEPEMPFAPASASKPVEPVLPYHDIRLSPIPMESIVKVVSKHHHLKSLPPRLLSAFGKAEGHPLLALEMAQSLKDWSIMKSGEGLSDATLRSVDPEQAFNGSSFSSTLQRVISQRTDLLKPTEQLTLKVASVFGDSFNFADLTFIYPSARSKEHILEDLNSLTELNILKKQPPPPAVEDLYKDDGNNYGNLSKEKMKESKKRRRRVAITECRCNLTKLARVVHSKGEEHIPLAGRGSGIGGLGTSGDSIGVSSSGGINFGFNSGSGGLGVGGGGILEDEDGDELSSNGTDSSEDDSKVIYCFTQGVTRDTVYNSIVYSQRRGFHASVVELYEVKFAKLGERGLDPYLRLLAEHCLKAGNWLKAVDYLERAADRALEGSANKEAVGYLHKIMDIARKWGGLNIDGSLATPGSSPSPTRRGSGNVNINIIGTRDRSTSLPVTPSTTTTTTTSSIASSLLSPLVGGGGGGGGSASILGKAGEGVTKLRAASWQRRLGEAHFALQELDQAETHTRSSLQLMGHTAEDGSTGWMQYQLASEIIKQFAKKKLYSSSKKRAWCTPPSDFQDMLELARGYLLLSQIRFFNNEFYVASALAMKAVRFAEMAGIPSKELARGYGAMCYVTSCASLKSLSKQFSRSSLEITENSNEVCTVLDVLLMTCHYQFTNAKWKVLEKRLGRALDICFCSCGQTDTARKQNVLLFAASYWISKGQHAQALALYEDIARRKPGDDSSTPAYSLLGKSIALAYLGQLEEAQEILYHQNRTFFGRQEIIFRQILCALIHLRRRDYVSSADTIMSIFEQLKDKVIMQHLNTAFFWSDFEILSFALEVCLLLWEYDLTLSESMHDIPSPLNSPSKERGRSASASASSGEQSPLRSSMNGSGMSKVSLSERLVQWNDTCNKLSKMLNKYTKVFVAAKPRWLRFTAMMKHLAGHPKTAQRGWQKALDVADKMGMAYECGVIHLWMGRATHESDRRRKQLELALQVFARDEKGWYLSWCREELELMAIASSSSSSSSSPHSSLERKKSMSSADSSTYSADSGGGTELEEM